MKKILWIEDDMDLIAAVKLLLEHEGWEVHNAYSVDDGEEMADRIIPDLIIMDIILDRKHGFSGIKELKNNPKFTNTPIIIYSGFSNRFGETTASREDVLFTKAEEFIEKSEGPEALIKAIQKYLKSDS